MMKMFDLLCKVPHIEQLLKALVFYQSFTLGISLYKSKEIKNNFENIHFQNIRSIFAVFKKK